MWEVEYKIEGQTKQGQLQGKRNLTDTEDKTKQNKIEREIRELQIA